MPVKVKTLKGLKRQQERQKLKEQGYSIANHHYSALDMDKILHIAINRLADNKGQEFEKVFHQIATELSRVKRYTRVRDKDKQGQEVNVFVSCLRYGNPEAIANLEESQRPEAPQ